MSFDHTGWVRDFDRFNFFSRKEVKGNPQDLSRFDKAFFVSFRFNGAQPIEAFKGEIVLFEGSLYEIQYLLLFRSSIASYPSNETRGMKD